MSATTKTVKSTTSLPKGFRDLYWCWVMNEPMIIEYKDDRAICGVCGDWQLDFGHTFIMHIRKPNEK